MTRRVTPLSDQRCRVRDEVAGEPTDLQWFIPGSQSRLERVAGRRSMTDAPGDRSDLRAGREEPVTVAVTRRPTV